MDDDAVTAYRVTVRVRLVRSGSIAR